MSLSKEAAGEGTSLKRGMEGRLLERRKQMQKTTVLQQASLA